MEKKLICSWRPCLSAPFNFTASVEWFYVKYGPGFAVGLGNVDKDYYCGGMTVSNPIDHNVNLFFPGGVDLVWSSWMERKWYVAEIDFDSNVKDSIKNAIRTNFASYDDEDVANIKAKAGALDIFHVCCFPGGIIRYFVESSDYNRVVSLDLFSQAKETHELDEDFLYGGRGMIRREEKYWSDMNDYFDEMLHEGKYKRKLESIEREFGEEECKRIEHYRKYGAPDPSLWDAYFTRYKYSINIELEDSESELFDETCYFTNAEMYHRYFSVNPGNVIKQPAALRKMVFGWKSKGYYYSCYVYFNEEETFRFFRDAFSGDDNNVGELNIFVSKYNNYIDFSLVVGDKKYRFEKMQVDIANRERFYDNADRVFENYEGAHQEFVGR